MITGSLQIKRGIYQMVINLTDENGKNKPKWISTRLKTKNNKRKAEDMLRKTIRDYGDFKVNMTASKLFSDYLLSWIDIVQQQVSQTTFRSYNNNMKNIIAPYFKTHKILLQNVKPSDIQSFYTKRLKNGVSPNTIKRYHANIRKALEYAVRTNIIPFNPADRVELPKQSKYVSCFYNKEEIKKLISLVGGNILETPVIFGAIYGLRRSEIVGLKWSAFDFRNNTFSIKYTITGMGKNQVKEAKTKNKSSYRTLPLLTSIKEYLLKLKKYQETMRAFYGDTYIDSDFICTWEDGRLIQPDYITKYFKKLLIENKMDVIRFHDLRHSAASMLINSGHQLKEISEWLGHGDIGTTANIYGHLQFETKVKMGNALEDMLVVNTL